MTYNGHGMEEFVPQRTSAYVSQFDLYIGEMTVRETLAFSARCQGVGDRYGTSFSPLRFLMEHTKPLRISTIAMTIIILLLLTDMLTELSRREKEANIMPDPDRILTSS